MTGFHEELRESAVGPARRELRGEKLVPVLESGSSAGVAVESKPLKLPSFDVKNHLTFGGSVQSVAVAKTTIPLIGFNLGFLSSIEKRVYFEGQGEIGFGDGNESLQKYSLSNVVTTELAGGFVLNPDSDIVVAVDYRVGQRRGTLTFEDRNALISKTTTENFELKLKGPCLKLSQGEVDGTGVGFELWAFQAEGNSKTIPAVNGLRFRMGFYHGF